MTMSGTTPLDIIIDFPKNDDFVEEDDYWTSVLNTINLIIGLQKKK